MTEKRNGSTVPDWFKTIEPEATLKAVRPFYVDPEDDKQRGCFGNKVYVSPVGKGRVIKKGQDTVTVIFEENLNHSGGVTGKIVTAHPSKFEPVW